MTESDIRVALLLRDKRKFYVSHRSSMHDSINGVVPLPDIPESLGGLRHLEGSLLMKRPFTYVPGSQAYPKVTNIARCWIELKILLFQPEEDVRESFVEADAPPKSRHSASQLKIPIVLNSARCVPT